MPDLIWYPSYCSKLFQTPMLHVKVYEWLWHGFGGTSEKAAMKENKERQQEPEDPNLDIPAEANRSKHINFLDVEEDSSTKTGVNADNFAAERQKQWKEGLKEGEEALRNNEP